MHLLQIYVSSLLMNNTGRTRFERLYLIGVHCPSMSLEALHAAISEAKGGKDILRYEGAVSTLREISPNDPMGSGDSAWVDRTRKQVKTETDRLEAELKGYKNNLIRESIRVSHFRPYMKLSIKTCLPDGPR